MKYNASEVKLLIETHTKDCASNKSTFSHYKEVSEEEFHEYLNSFAEIVYKEANLYGACGRWFYNNNKEVAKVVYEYGDMCFYIYSEEGFGERFECNCKKVNHELTGFASDEQLTIERIDNEAQ